MHRIEPQMVHVYFANTNMDLGYNNLLSADETLKASKFKFEKNRNQYIVSKSILRVLAGYYLNKDPKNIEFSYGEFGKPEFKMDTKLKFNISHSGNIAVLAFVLNHAIGVDIEKIKTDLDIMDIASNYFSAMEIKCLHKFPKEKLKEGFYRCWTRKESFIKAKAQGLSFPLDSFSVCINSHEKTELLETIWDEAEKNRWSLFTFSPHQDYIGAVSVHGDVKSIHYFNFNDYNNMLS